MREGSLRIQKFHSLKTHPWYSRQIERLKKSDLQIIETFIRENDQLDHEKFEMTLNRYFLNREKPKNYTLILEILSSSNDGLKPERG